MTIFPAESSRRERIIVLSVVVAIVSAGFLRGCVMPSWFWY